MKSKAKHTDLAKFHASSVVLFTEWPKPEDRRFVERLEAAEFERHLALCRLAILRAGRIGCSWADLPQHPIIDYNTAVILELESLGFEITHDTPPRAHWYRKDALPAKTVNELRRRADVANRKLRRKVRMAPENAPASATLRGPEKS